MQHSLNIVIGGEAGQGLVTIGTLLTKTLVQWGYKIVVTQSYESRIRGGHNTFAIRASAEPIQAPRESVDLLVALNEETIRLHRHELSSKGFIIVTEASVQVQDAPYLAIPFKQLASPRYENVVALGVVTNLLGVDRAVPEAVLDQLFGKKGPQVIEENLKALSDSYEWASQQFPKMGNIDLNFFKLPEASHKVPPLLLNGNEALALGALSAGVKFCAFYPMTPSTSIVLNLISHAKRMGVIIEQAEDEIAAINMALGASFAGAPSMVATSGGGFALMTEGVSLAAMTETPIVVMVAQRPGPATGLPTRTEQADLEFVLHGGHGEFPRAILTPGSVEECFHLARKAFELAERYQSPVFVLTDQFLADSYRVMDSFDAASLSSVQVGADPEQIEAPYRRYALTEDGISPRLLPGMSQHLVVADSDEHNEEGHLTEDLSVRIQMARKRMKKLEGLKKDVIPPSYDGEDQPDVLLISWGTVRGMVQEAASELRSGGKKVATLHFSQIWPLVPDQFTEYLEKAKETVCIETNLTGQFARLLRRETGFQVGRQILRYDGLPITPEMILRELNSRHDPEARKI